MKEFLPYEIVRNNALKLAHKIFTDGFTPNVIYVSLRGGAYLGNVISEYFKIRSKNDRPIFYAAVVARSYTDIFQNDKIMIDGWTYSPEYLRHGDKILLVDDIFDSGKTINYLVDILLEKGIPRKDIKVAVHDYKIKKNKNDMLPVQPDYYCRKHLIDESKQDNWIHYLSHELIGLTEDELEEYYYSKDAELKDILTILDNNKDKIL